MANEGPQIRRSYIAASDLHTKQFSFVKLTADRTVDVCSAITDKPIGVLQNSPKLGEEATVTVFGETKAIASAALTAGAQVGTTATGTVKALVAGTDTTAYVVGTVEAGVANAASLVTIFVNAAAAHRAA